MRIFLSLGIKGFIGYDIVARDNAIFNDVDVILGTGSSVALFCDDQNVNVWFHALSYYKEHSRIIPHAPFIEVTQHDVVPA